jgi:membrane-associated phospholipid phosphatase
MVTRVYVGAHNPLDVVGGIALGIAIACVLDAIIAATGGWSGSRATTDTVTA